MSLMGKVRYYKDNKKNNIPFFIIFMGLVLSPFFKYSWIIAIIGCIFLNKDDIG